MVRTPPPPLKAMGTLKSVFYSFNAEYHVVNIELLIIHGEELFSEPYDLRSLNLEQKYFSASQQINNCLSSYYLGEHYGINRKVIIQ
ncbi:hypothetical protein EON65_47420 [archaeon]|nr:MAG: hypothetical protein EON65_47420 [archaeon]